MRSFVSIAMATAIIMSAQAGVAQPLLDVEKTGVPNPVSAGNLVTYTMVGLNPGPGAALKLQLQDP
jgi:hypothetical protein